MIKRMRFNADVIITVNATGDPNLNLDENDIYLGVLLLERIVNDLPGQVIDEIAGKKAHIRLHIRDVKEQGGC